MDPLISNGTSLESALNNQKVKANRCLICGFVSNVHYDLNGKPQRVTSSAFKSDGDPVVVSQYGPRISKGSGEESLLQWEKSLLEAFFKAMKVTRAKQSKCRWSVLTEPVPFCEDCKYQVASLQGLLEELEKIEKNVAAAVDNLKEKMNEVEEEFQKEEVYWKDERYYWGRAHVIGTKKVGLAPNSFAWRFVSKKNKNEDETEEPSNSGPSQPKLSRADKETLKLGKLALGENGAERNNCQRTSSGRLLEKRKSTNETIDKKTPLVKISRIDKEIVDGQLQPDFIKVEVEDEPFQPENSMFDEAMSPFHSSSPPPTPPSPVFQDAIKRQQRESSSKSSPRKATSSGRKKKKKATPPPAPASASSTQKFDEAELEYSAGQRSRRARKSVVYKNELELELLGLENDDDEDDDDKPSSSLSSNKRKASKISQPPEDKDFVPEMNEEGEPAEPDSAEEEDEDETTGEFFEETLGRGGKPLKYPKLKFHQESGAWTFLHVSFEQVDDDTYKCLKCGKTVFSKVHLKKHTIRFHTNKFPCPRPGCEYRADSNGNLQRHILKTHEGKNLYAVECDICGRPIGKKILLRHKITHYNADELKKAEESGELDCLKKTENGNFVCGECGKSFQKRHLLHRHEEAYHAKSKDGEIGTLKDEKSICPDCGKIFQQEHSLKAHQRREHADKSTLQFACPYCDKRFLRNGELVKHKWLHTGERPFSCKLCARQFVTQRNLKFHMDLHNNIRPFKCSECEMAFVKSHDLRKHFNNYHTPGSKPKRKSYIRGPEKGQFRVRLTANQNVHVGNQQRILEFQEKPLPHQCSYCCLSFQYPSQLKRHELRYHASEEHKTGQANVASQQVQIASDLNASQGSTESPQPTTSSAYFV